MLLPSNLRLLKVTCLYSFKHYLIQLNILWSFAWSREHLNKRAQALLSLLPQPHFQWIPAHPHPTSQPLQTHKISAPFPTHLVLSLLGPFTPLHISAWVLSVLSSISSSTSSPTWFLQITVFSPIGSNNKGKAKTEAGSITCVKELRGPFCLELKPKLFAFLQ